jgi:hypothetical protein
MIIGTFKTQAKGYAGNLITLTHRGKLTFTAADEGGHQADKDAASISRRGLALQAIPSGKGRVGYE